MLSMLERHPELAVVIDHCAKPDIAAGAWQTWADDLAAIAGNSTASCKLSGLVTEAGDSWTVASIRRYFDHVLECFGSERVLWGSDWPVVTLAASYDAWSAATDTLLGVLPREGSRCHPRRQRAAILCVRWLVRVPLQARAMQYRRRDFLDRLGRRVEHGDCFALHHLLRFAHFVAAILERRVCAARADARRGSAAGVPDRSSARTGDRGTAAPRRAVSCRRSHRASAGNSPRECRTASAR